MKTQNFLECLLMGIVVILGAYSCKDTKPPIVTRETVAMDTFVKITVMDDGIPTDRVHSAIDSAVALIRWIERIATDYDDSSEVGRINCAAGVDGIGVSGELIEMLESAKRYGDISEGKFDVTIGPIVKEWNFLSEFPVVPADSSLETLLPLVDYRKIEIMEDSVRLHSTGMRLDLGGIAKGFAVDRAAHVLRSGGLNQFIIDIGGNLFVETPAKSILSPEGVEVMIRHPRKADAFLGRMMCGTAGVATSGDYQRFFENDGNRYHHILDPGTGKPAGGVVSVTVIAESGIAADAISTIVFLLGKEKGMEFIHRTPGVEGLIVYEEGDSLVSIVSIGLRDRIELFHD